MYDITLETDFDLKVGAHTVHVRFVPTSHIGLGDNHGTWVPNSYTIYIFEDNPYSVRLSTFLHELLHVFEAFYSIDVDHKDINLIGDMLAMVLLDNFQVAHVDHQSDESKGAW